MPKKKAAVGQKLVNVQVKLEESLAERLKKDIVKKHGYGDLTNLVRVILNKLLAEEYGTLPNDEEQAFLDRMLKFYRHADHAVFSMVESSVSIAEWMSRHNENR